LQVPFLVAAPMWRAAVHVSAAVPVAAAGTGAPAAAAVLVAAASSAALAVVLPSFDVLFECAPFLGLC